VRPPPLRRTTAGSWPRPPLPLSQEGDLDLLRTYPEVRGEPLVLVPPARRLLGHDLGLLAHRLQAGTVGIGPGAESGEGFLQAPAAARENLTDPPGLELAAHHGGGEVLFRRGEADVELLVELGLQARELGLPGGEFRALAVEGPPAAVDSPR
jgi:hypothetical protein